MRELAQRAVASPHWRWMAGMGVVYRGRDGLTCGRLADVGGRVVIDEAGVRAAFAHAEYLGRFVEAAFLDAFDLLPDLEDPATLGCLLALVRETWGRPALAASPAGAFDGSVSWCVEALDPNDGDGYHALTPRRATEAEALVDALEEAPCESSE